MPPDSSNTYITTTKLTTRLNYKIKSGSGRHGTVFTKEDALNFLVNKSNNKVVQKETIINPTTPLVSSSPPQVAQERFTAPVVRSINFNRERKPNVEEKPISQMRKTIASRLGKFIFFFANK